MSTEDYMRQAIKGLEQGHRDTPDLLTHVKLTNEANPAEKLNTHYSKGKDQVYYWGGDRKAS